MSRKRSKRRREQPQSERLSGYKPRKLVPRSGNQRLYIQSIRDNDITLCHGPAGTGKTHIAAGVAVRMMKANSIEKICLCRPIVGVGKDIGYLPGTKEEKIIPYLIPLFDELGFYCQNSLLREWADTGKLETVPISMMRGRTFNDCFVILDEAQNATMMELRMLMTRIGVNSKMVIAGDLNQSDLPKSAQGAFNLIIDNLNDIRGIGIKTLLASDIVRHSLIGPIESRLAHLTESQEK